MTTSETRLIETLNASTRCLGEAALALQKHGEASLAADLLKQVTENNDVIREITGP